MTWGEGAAPRDKSTATNRFGIRLVSASKSCLVLRNGMIRSFIADVVAASIVDAVVAIVVLLLVLLLVLLFFRRANRSWVKDQKAKDSNWVEPWIEKQREAERAAGSAPSVRSKCHTVVVPL